MFVMGIAIAILFLLAVKYTSYGFKAYSDSFGPNFYSALVGGCIGASISLIVVLVGFIMQRDIRSRALESLRYLFLRKEAEELKESYIAFVDTLRIGGQDSIILAGKSWQALEKENWPDIKTIKLIEKNFSRMPISGLYDSNAIAAKYERLRNATESVVLMSATPVFEGKERLISGILWDADYNIHAIRNDLRNLTSQDIDISLSVVSERLEEIAISTSRLLINLSNLAKDVRVK